MYRIVAAIGNELSAEAACFHSCMYNAIELWKSIAQLFVDMDIVLVING